MKLERRHTLTQYKLKKEEICLSCEAGRRAGTLGCYYCKGTGRAVWNTTVGTWKHLSLSIGWTNEKRKKNGLNPL